MRSAVLLIVLAELGALVVWGAVLRERSRNDITRGRLTHPRFARSHRRWL